MRFTQITAIIWLVFAMIPGLVQAQSNAVHLRGSYAQMELPPGFSEEPGMPSVVWPAAEASILFTELPVEAFQAISDGLISDPTALLGDGIELDAAANIVQHGQNGVLAYGRQQVGANLLSKWLLLIGAPHVTLLVTAQAPATLVSPDRRAVIEQALASIRVSETRSDPRDSLPFVFAESSRMKFHRILSGTTALLVARGADTGEAVRPVFAIGSSHGDDCSPWADGTTPYAEQLIGSMKRTKDLTNVVSRSAVIHDDPAIITEANAIWHDQPVTLFQTIRFRGCQYLRTIGIVPVAEADSYRPEFDQLVTASQWRGPAQK